MKKIYLLLLFIPILITSCERGNIITPDPPPSVSITGAYILAEGGFSPGSAVLSFYNIPENIFTENIFNPGSLGLFPSGIVQHNGFLYVTEQGNFGSPGKVYKLDSNGTVITVNPSVGINPYGITIANGKVYVTNGPASNVSVLDENTLSLITTVPVGEYPQEITSFGTRVYVCNTSEWGGNADSTVSVINALNDTVEKTITVRKDPTSIVVNNDYRIVVGCGGGSGMIYYIDKDTLGIADSAFIPDGFGKEIAVDKESSNIYFISGNGNIVRLNQQNKFTEIVIQAPVTSLYYGYNFDWRNRKHYVLDARNFVSPGRMEIFSIGGTLERTLTTGISPRRVIFK